MKQLFSAMLACGLLVASPVFAETALQLPPPEAAIGPSLCLDSMEELPMNDDLVPVPVSMADGCRVAGGEILHT